MPKPIFNKRSDEAAFYEEFFAGTVDWVRCSPDLIDRAYDYGCQFGLSAIDALHIAAANLSHAHEFITTESSHRPLGRVPASIVSVVSIHDTR